MVRLVDDLLDLSRISRGRIELRRERVDLATIVNASLESSRPFIEAAGHTLTISLPPEPVYLNADLSRLAQVLMNLLNNAAKYTESGGQVHLGAERQQGQVVIRVRDTGIGIPPHMLGRIFEMFAQVDRSLERSQGGLGIGLTLVRNLVDLHGGSVEAQSAGVGQGSEFIVRLPVAAEQSSSAVTAGSAGGDQAKAAAACRRILAVDDNRDSAESLAVLLRFQGHDVQTAHDGPEAVAVAATYRPEVVLLDIGLPGLNGYDVARAIRKHSPDPVILVAVTGWGQDDDRRRAREAGFDYHLVKPVDINGLQKLLNSLGPPAS
jgi:CheY-like chemotaxis protein/two-component sensor histidine kinase